jgi:N6-adenosine-specific RNA methylase IME4
MDDWGFAHKQIYTWVKLGKNEASLSLDAAEKAKLAFGMGRYFRGCSEHALIGTRGKVSKHIQARAERSVILHPALPHSQKPESLQTSLMRMLPGPYLEMFARRQRAGWVCVGDECPTTIGQDIRTWKSPRVK